MGKIRWLNYSIIKYRTSQAAFVPIYWLCVSAKVLATRGPQPKPLMLGSKGKTFQKG